MLRNKYYAELAKLTSLSMLGDLSHKCSHFRTRARSEISCFLNSLVGTAADINTAALHLSRSTHPIIRRMMVLIKNAMTDVIIKKKKLGKRKRRKPNPSLTKQYLLAKDETGMSDQYYQVYQSVIDKTEEAPSIHQVTAMRKKINKELQAELFEAASVQVEKEIDKSDPYKSTLLDIKKVINFIFTIHTARFGVDQLPADVEFKFTFDGRLNAKKEEVLIALVPCNTLFPPQSTYSTFPIAIQQCTEEDSGPTILKYMNEAKKLQLEPFTFTHDEEQHNVNISFVIGSDLKSLWQVTGLKYGHHCAVDSATDTPFCPYCLLTSSAISKIARGEKRTILPKLEIDSLNFIYCSLHATIRITEKFIKKAAEQAEQTQQLKEFQEDLKIFGVRIYVKESKFIRAYIDGDSAKKLLDIIANKGNVDGSQILAKYVKSIAFKKLFATWRQIAPVILQEDPVTIAQKTDLAPLLDSLWNDWTTLFTKGLNPYVHIITQHTLELLEVHGSIGKFCQQGLEYTNRLHKEITRNASQHNGGRYNAKTTKQTMLHFYRRMRLARDLKRFKDIFDIMKRETSAWTISLMTVETFDVQYNSDFIQEDGRTKSRKRKRKEKNTAQRKRRKNSAMQTAIIDVEADTNTINCNDKIPSEINYNNSINTYNTAECSNVHNSGGGIIPTCIDLTIDSEDERIESVPDPLLSDSDLFAAALALGISFDGIELP